MYNDHSDQYWTAIFNRSMSEDEILGYISVAKHFLAKFCRFSNTDSDHVNV